MTLELSRERDVTTLDPSRSPAPRLCVCSSGVVNPSTSRTLFWFLLEQSLRQDRSEESTKTNKEPKETDVSIMNDIF